MERALMWERSTMPTERARIATRIADESRTSQRMTRCHRRFPCMLICVSAICALAADWSILRLAGISQKRSLALINRQTSTVGVEVMDPALKPLKAALEAIRDMALNALGQIEPSQEKRSMRWECKECRYAKHFTKPVSLETAGRCARCKSTAFNAIL